MNTARGSLNSDHEEQILISHFYSEDSRQFTVVYSLVRSKDEDCGDSTLHNVFSVLCEMFTGDGNPSEYDFVYDVTRRESSAVAFLNLLCSCSVTPRSVKEIASDYFA